jgi:flagellar protein FliO/FliZ
MDSVFGVEIPGVAKFIIAFVVVLALIAVTAWVVRRFGSGALASVGGRGRQPRLAVIDAASVDARRKLILVRRDNVEHLLMIGGPSDVVIEPNIVRAAAARDLTAPRTPAIQDAMPRPAPLDEETMWPLQPEAGPRPQRPGQPVSSPTAAQWSPASPPQTETSALRTTPPDTLAELADALATPAPPRPTSKPVVAPVVTPPEAAVASATPPAAAKPTTDPDLTKMAQQLEAALRRPGGSAPRVDVPAAERRPSEPVIGPPNVADAQSERRVVHALEAELAVPEVRPADPETRPPESKKFYETLEQEMASLLGRPTGKT